MFVGVESLIKQVASLQYQVLKKWANVS